MVENQVHWDERWATPAGEMGCPKSSYSVEVRPEKCRVSYTQGVRELRHTGSIRDYVKTFSILILDIRGMSENDKLSTLLEGLRPLARLELQRQWASDLSLVMGAAKRIMNFQDERRDFQVPTHAPQQRSGGPRLVRPNASQCGGNRSSPRRSFS